MPAKTKYHGVIRTTHRVWPWLARVKRGGKWVHISRCKTAREAAWAFDRYCDRHRLANSPPNIAWRINF